MRFNKGLVLASILSASLFYGCGGEEESNSSGGATKTPAQHKAASGPATGTSSITGTVTLAGEAPKPVALKLGADAKCAKMHPKGATSKDYVIDGSGNIRWVFVRITEGLEGHKYETPSEPVLLDQAGCRYEPHVFGLMAGQGLKIRNSDDTMHNIHSLPKNSRAFNLAMPRKGMELTKKFKKPETMVRIKCDVHPWMESWAGVVSNPFYAVTNDQGSYKIENLPAGTYTIEVWHEELGVQSQSVTVGDGEAKEMNFKLQVQT